MDSLPGPADRPTEPVGAVLARWRKRRGLTGQALGDRVGMSQAKISRIETGAVAAEPRDVRLLAEALKMPSADTERVVELAEHADDRLIEWTSAGRDQADRQREYGRMEASAKQLLILQPALVPGLLQTSEYARAILGGQEDYIGTSRLADSAVTEAVNARMQRNQILHSPGQEFRFLITEQVLRSQVCKPAEMISQIDRMREVAGFPNVHLMVITDDTQLPVVPSHGFVVADDRWVSVDLLSTSLRSGGRKTVQVHRQIFEALERVATTEIDDLLDRYQAHYVRMLLAGTATK